MGTTVVRHKTIPKRPEGHEGVYNDRDYEVRPCHSPIPNSLHSPPFLSLLQNRGWCCLETGVSGEAIAYAQYFTGLNAVLDRLPPKIIEIDGDGPRVADADEVGGRDEGTGPRIERVRASLRAAKFTGKGDDKVVVKLYNDYVAKIGDAVVGSGEVMEAMTASGIDYTIFFYNPNIHPKEEYLLRKEENIRFAEAHNVPFVDADYDTVNWFKRARGMEHEPERGIRCTMCFDMRFELTALYARENGFPVITSSLGISRWKDMNQINGSGERAASHYPDLSYWTFNWRKGGGAARMIDISKREQFYQQEYCGCVYSLRDTNKWRVSQGRKEVNIGKTFYGVNSDKES